MSAEPTHAEKTDRDLVRAELSAAAGAVATASIRLAALVRRSDVVTFVASSVSSASVGIVRSVETSSRRVEAVARTLEQLTAAFGPLDEIEKTEAGIAANRLVDREPRGPGFDEQSAADQQEAAHAAELAHASVAFDNGWIPGTTPYRDRRGPGSSADGRRDSGVWHLCSRNPAKRCDCNAPMKCEGGPAVTAKETKTVGLLHPDGRWEASVVTRKPSSL